jgi:hypothetical protein
LTAHLILDREVFILSNENEKRMLPLSPCVGRTMFRARKNTVGFPEEQLDLNYFTFPTVRDSVEFSAIRGYVGANQLGEINSSPKVVNCF